MAHFESDDDRQAVRAMAGYARLLYYHGPELYSEDAMKCYRKTSVIGEKAAFSPHAVSKEERKDTALCVQKMKKELKKARSWYGNWIMKYIERLY